MTVEALGVFADDGEVGSRARQGDRAEVGEKIEALAQLENRGAVGQASAAQVWCQFILGLTGRFGGNRREESGIAAL